MTINRLTRITSLLVFSMGVALLAACAPGSVTNDTNTNDGNSGPTVEGSSIETSEPEQYQATVAVSVGTTGAIEAKAKALQANVARNGDRRRMEITLPGGEEIVYLTIGERQMVILPESERYTEIDKETYGLELRKLVAPEEIIGKIKGYDQVQQASEEEWYGRDVVKYSLLDKNKTETSAGKVETGSYALIDKETRLPLKTVFAVRSEEGSVAGVSGLKAVTEITNLKTEAGDDMFKEPTEYEKVSSEDVRNQIEKFYDSAKGLVGQLFDSAQEAVN